MINLLNPHRFVTAGGGGGIQYESHTSVQNGSASDTVTLTKPSGVSNDDILLLIAGDSSNSAFTAPSGWTHIYADTYLGCNINACYRIADGTEGGTVDYSNSDASRLKVGSYIHVSGNATTSPVDAVSAVNQGANGTSYTIPALTSTVADTLVFYASSFDGGDGAPLSQTAGGGWTEREAHNAGTGADDAAVIWGTKELASIGTTGTVEVNAAVSDGFATCMFIIKPA